MLLFIPVVIHYTDPPDIGQHTFAKMVDLDPEDDIVPAIYGWSFRIENFFKADVYPTPFKYLWKKVDNNVEGTQDRSVLGVTQHTFLENITWLEGASSSPFLRALRDAMSSSGSTKLSMRFHMDQYQHNCTCGRIVGAIGPSGRRAPLTVINSRELEPVEWRKAKQAPFVLDRASSRIHVDLGNSLRMTTSGAVQSHGQLAAGYYKHGYLQEKDGCSDDLLWLGPIDYQRPDWYRTTAGIESLPGSEPLTMETMKELEKSPLVVAEVRSEWA